MSETFLGENKEGKANLFWLQILAIRKITAGYILFPLLPLAAISRRVRAGNDTPRKDGFGAFRGGSKKHLIWSGICGQGGYNLETLGA